MRLLRVISSRGCHHLFQIFFHFSIFFAQGRHEHEAYTGDRTKDSLVTFADSLVPSAGQPHLKHGQLKAAPRTPGCNVAGVCGGGGWLAVSKRGGGRGVGRGVAWRGVEYICIAARTGSETF